MASKSAGHAVGLAGGFATGIMLALVLGHGPNLMSEYEVCQGESCAPLGWSEWIRQGGLDFVLFSLPLGAALAGFLATVGLIRWRGVLSGILVVVILSLVGAIMSYPMYLDESFGLICELLRPVWESFGAYMKCPGTRFTFSPAFDLLIVVPVFVAMTTTVGLLARRIVRAGSV
jgi:hypothetical protein